MRVLVITNNFPQSSRPQDGIFILRQIQALQQLGWNARVVRFIPWAPLRFGHWKQYIEVPDEYEYGGIKVSTVRVVLLPRFGLMQSISLQTRHFMRKQLNDYRPDVIQAHQIIPTGLMSMGHGYPVVVTAHGSDAYNYPYRNSGFRRAAESVLSAADEVVAVSGFIAGHAELLGARNVHIVFNGADANVFYPADRIVARAKLKLAPDRPVIAFAGALEEAKGVFELVTAMRQISDLNPVVLIAGTGGAARLMEARLLNLGVDHRFVGVISHQDLALLFAACDLVTLPSHREGLPAVICEAMLAGRAVVASAVGGIEEIVRDRVTGLVVSPKDSTALAQALRETLTNVRLRQEIESKAYEFARAHLTWSVNAGEYDALYRSAIAKYAVRRPRLEAKGDAAIVR